ncbi:hypothetical protein H2198_000431 [Neophaeococcomyces mojaviensis]|uniref:Uncharacterized protein n=1 Tax=Neophaeococcomyces mojaviensis TaxID=3383035 RepID=A0ACC3AKH4_9EURO|nr:hypothetical protein H2198_000431 [Knufia sp. JES_112]
MAIDLLNLPDEILALIVSHLDTASLEEPAEAKIVSKPELCALALTCRRISSLTREHIFGCIALKHHNPYLWSISSSGGASRSCSDLTRRDGDRIKLLMRAWNENQYLLLRGLQCVTWHTEYFDPSLREEFFDCLARSESLVKLNLLGCSREDVRRLTARIHSPARRSYFTKLQTLRIRPNDPAAIYSSLLSSLCTAPTLRELNVPAHSISVHVLCETSSAFFNEADRPSNTDLETLRIGAASHVDIATFERILPQCTKLKQLFCPPPEPGIAFEDGGWRPYPEDTGRKFSSTLVSQALLPVADTLEVLSMTDPNIIFTAQDESCLDLSAFSVLRKLCLSNSVLLGPQQPAPPRGSFKSAIWRRLPPSLEELCVTFDGLEGIFYSIESLEITAAYPSDFTYSTLWDNGPGSEEKVSQALTWVTEIAERKRGEQFLSQLRKVELVECHTPPFLPQSGVEIRLKTLSLRSEHAKLFRTFEEAEIMVDLRIYVPNEWPMV